MARQCRAPRGITDKLLRTRSRIQGGRRPTAAIIRSQATQAIMAALSRPARQDNPHLAMGLAQGLAVHRDMEIRSISIRLPVLHLQASSISQTLALPLRRTVTHTLREAVDQQTRQQLTCLHPGTQLIMPRAMPCTLLMLCTT